MVETLIDGSVHRASLWEEGDLVRRLCHVLDTAARALEMLAADGYTDLEEPENSVRPEKLISETALLLRAAAPVTSYPGVQQRLEAVAKVLIPFARSERMALGICLHPPLSLEYAQAHICLTRLGWPDEDFDRLLEKSLSSACCNGKERVPHRALEMDWIQRVWSNNGNDGPVHHAAWDSVLKHPMDLLHGTREDVYAFTHALMYLRDFNQLSLGLPRSRDAIVAEAEAALARCLDEQDYDLAGEILLTWPLTGSGWSAAAAFAFRVLMRVEDQAGFLPAPITRLHRLRKLEGQARERYFLATAYHTIYVMGLLCSSALQPSCRTQSKLTPPSRNAVSEKILKYLNTPAAVPHWRGELDDLHEFQREAISEFLLDIALYRNVKQRSYGMVRDLMELAFEFDLANGPCARQAAELLDRLTFCAPFLSSLRPELT